MAEQTTGVLEGKPASKKWPQPKITADGLTIALEDLHNDYYDKTAEVIKRLLQNRGNGDWLIAEELVSRTFERAWNSIHKFDSSLGTLEGWIRIYADRVVRTWEAENYNKRQLDTEPEWFQRLIDDGQALDDQIETNLLYQAVREVMRQLNWRQRVAILLHDKYGMTFDEISHTLGESPNTWSSRASRGRQRLRGLLTLEEGNVQSDLLS
jgi:RNA polymerase sigma factor (sigma-70 family)